MNQFGGQVAIVTGARQGQGHEHVRRLAEAGARVLAVDVQPAAAESFTGEVRQVQADVQDEAAWRTIVEQAESAFGPIGMLVNNAAVYQSVPLVEMSLEDWNRILQVNLTGTFLGIKHVAASMRRNGSGVIVNVSSTAGLKGLPGLSAYGASKWGVRGLTKVAALELARDNIRVNSVHPGVIRTAMAATVTQSRVDVQPVDRWGTVDDVTNMVMFLLSDSSGFCTGSEFIVDGGSMTGSVAVRGD